MISGFEFKRRLELSWDAAYSGYYDDTKMNRLISKAFYNIVERDYRTLQSQKQYDEISNLIKTGEAVTLRDSIFHTSLLPITNVSVAGSDVTITTARPHYMDLGDNITVSSVAGATVTNINGSFAVTAVPTSTTFSYASTTPAIVGYLAGSGSVATDGYMLSDYYHYFAIKTYAPLSYTASITNIVQNDAGGYTDVFCPNHNVRQGDAFTISGVLGTAAANGSWTSSAYTIRNKNVIRISSALLGTYISGGTLVVVVDEWATPYVSDSKISVLNNPSPTNTKVETQNGTLKFYPSSVSSVEVDYMTKLPYDIDVTRTNDDLTLYYSEKFLDLLVMESVLQASGDTRDDRRYQTSMQDIQMNP